MEELARVGRRAAVGKCQTDALVQERQLAKTVGQNLILVFGGMGKYLAVGLERDARTAILAIADDVDRRSGRTLRIALTVDLAAAVDLGDQKRRQCIDARYAHAVQTARYLVAALVELTAGMQHRQDDLQSRLALLLVEVGRDASAVVLDRYRIVFVYGNVYVGTVTGQRLVYGVVHDLVYEMVQTLLADIADIHGGAFANGFQALQHLDVGGGILLFLLQRLFLFGIHLSIEIYRL